MYRFRSKLERRVWEHIESKVQGVRFEPYPLSYTLECQYTPDFVLPNGIILEVKGFFRPTDRRKMVSVKAHHPELDIRFVFQAPSKTLTRVSKTTYGDWADKHGFPWCSADSIPESWLS